MLQHSAFEAAQRNAVLRGVEAAELRALAPRLQLQHLAAGTQLHERGRPVLQIYFPVGCVIAVVQAMRDGRSAQAAAVGREGMVGLGGLSQINLAAASTVVQIAGEALVAAPAELHAALAELPSLAGRLERYERVFLMQIIQSVGCNQLHSLRQRLCRHLLALRDAAVLERGACDCRQTLRRDFAAIMGSP